VVSGIELEFIGTLRYQNSKVEKINNIFLKIIGKIKRIKKTGHFYVKPVFK